MLFLLVLLSGNEVPPLADDATGFRGEQWSGE